METTDAFRGLRCTDCGQAHDATATGRCDCGGLLDADYDHGEVDFSGDGLERYSSLLPFPDLVTLETGGTPLVEAPALADDLGVAAVYVKDEGRNATGAAVDRGLAVAVTAAREAGRSDVALPTTGNGGQAAAAHAARAGLDSHSFVPSRAPFVNKAMINVHGGDMNVVGGRYPDAVSAFEGSSEDWYSVAPGENPYRVEGAKTLAYELSETVAADAVVHPTAHGTGIVGLEKGFRELVDLGRVEDPARLYAAQANGCAPIADAWERGADATEPWDQPDTIVGSLEVPDPAGGDRALAALDATDGAAVGSGDDPILEGATDLASAGLTMSVTGGAAVAGARALAEQGAFAADETLVLVNPVTGNKEEDVLRSHLMKQGI